MKTKTFKLSLWVEVDPQGETVDTIKRQLSRVVSNAINNGLLTGDTAATVEDHRFTVSRVRSRPNAKYGWNCFYNRSRFWFSNKRDAVACGKELESQKQYPYKATIKPATRDCQKSTEII